MRYWREVNNEEEEVEEVEKEGALPLEVKEEQEERQKEGDATLRIKMTVIISWNFYESIVAKPENFFQDLFPEGRVEGGFKSP